MVTFRNNNNRRNNFRRNTRNFKSNGDRQKFSPSFSNNENFQRKIPGRNNHNFKKSRISQNSNIKNENVVEETLVSSDDKNKKSYTDQNEKVDENKILNEVN